MSKDSTKDKKTYSKNLLKHINHLLDKSKKHHPGDKLDKYFRYYKGDFGGSDNSVNQRNVIMPIVEAKTTYINDAQISTAIVPQLHSQDDLQNYNTAEEIAEILNDCVKTVLKNNSEDSLRQKEVRAGSIFGIGITETLWDNEFTQVGDIKINYVLPRNFFPDPAATCIEDANFVFKREFYSAITLKAKYPQYADKIKELSQTNSSKATNWGNKEKTGMLPVTSNNKASLVFGYADENGYITENNEVFTCWRCYLKDDSTFVAESQNKNTTDGDNAKELMKKYPNGRVIFYIDGAKDFVLEDKEIDYPFGIPFDIYNPITSDDIWGIGDVEQLTSIQDRINRTYTKAQMCVHKSAKYVLNPKGSGIRKDSFKSDINIIDQVNMQMKPEVMDNGQIADLGELTQWADHLEDKANKISRLNDQMISGEHTPGVNSGVQIKALNESPMTTIRAMQRNYKDYCISRTKKIIALIQKYYNQQRILRISEGQKFIEIGTRQSDNEGNPIPGSGTLNIYQKQVAPTPEGQENQEIIKCVQTIQGDFSLGFYDVEVIAGTDVPRSPTERSQLMLQLNQMGLLPKGIIGIKLLFEALDVPQRHEILAALQEEQDKQSQQVQEPPAKTINVNFSDLPPVAQIEWLKNNGFPDASQQLQQQGMQQQVQPPEQQGMQQPMQQPQA